MAGELASLMMRLSVRVARYEAAEEEARDAQARVSVLARACWVWRGLGTQAVLAAVVEVSPASARRMEGCLL